MDPTAPSQARRTHTRIPRETDPNRESNTIDSGPVRVSDVERNRSGGRRPAFEWDRPVHYHITFAPEVLPRRMLYVVLALLAAHLLLAVCHFEIHRLPWLLRQLFDLDQENNIPSWYSGTALFVTAVFVWLCAREKKALQDPWTRQWYVLTTAFFFLAIDEIAGLHETFNTLIDMNWAIPGGVLAMCLGFVLTPFLLHLHRRTAVLFAISGIVYFGGAVVMELLAVPYNTNTLRYYMMTLWEEGLEMLGVVLFLYALLAYMGGQGKSSIRLGAGIKPAGAGKSQAV